MWLSQNKLISIETKVDANQADLDALIVDTTSIETKVDIVDTNVDDIEAGVNIIDGIVDSIYGRTSKTVTRDETTLPQATQAPLFTITGNVLITEIIGEVTTAIQAQETIIKLISNPTVGADVDLCALLDINNDAVGTMYNITGTLANNMIATTSGGFTSQALPIAVAAGTIDLDTDNDSSTGEIKWTLTYIPLGAVGIIEPNVTPADPQTIYYVSNTGDNANNGITVGTAWETLEYAEANATEPNSIIALERGNVWLIDNVFEITHGGTAGNEIVWDGDYWGAGAQAIIRSNSAGGNIPKYYSLMHIADCSYVTVQNITFDGNDTQRAGIVIGGDTRVDGPTAQNNENYITILDCEVTDVGAGAALNNLMIGILVKPFYTDMSNITIEGNTVDGTDAHGIAFYCANTQGAGGVVPGRQILNSTIKDNTVTNYNEYTGAGGVGVGIDIMNKCTNTLVEGNTVTTGVDGEGIAFSHEHNDTNQAFYPTGTIVRYNSFRVSGTDSNWTVLFQNGGAMTCDMYCNIVENDYNEGAAYSGGILFGTSGYGYVGAQFNLYFNTIITDGGHCIKNELTTTGCVVTKNNILTNRGLNNDRSCIWSTTADTTVANYNFYDRTGAHATDAAFVINGSTYYKTDGVLDLTNYDPYDQKGDPSYTTEFTDLRLAAPSDAIDTGLIIAGITLDYAGVALGTPPNQGCYETTT